ncbi:MAG: 4Fe-4S dicluster domain-containing protein [Syntrophobacteraceae bacterium]
MKQMHSGLRWYEIGSAVLILGIATMAFLLAVAALEEHEVRALAISAAVTVLAALALPAGFLLKRNGRLESSTARRALISFNLLSALFVASLLIRSDYSLDNKDIRRNLTGEISYDASLQPGNEVLLDLEKAISKDVLTFSIYDVCVGKVSHRVLRDGPVAEERVEVTNRMLLTEKIKADARELGADVVGITELDPRFVFTKDNDGNPVHLKHKYAIVIGKGLDYRLANPAAPGPWTKQYSAIPEEVAAILSGKNINSTHEIPPREIEEMRQTLEFFQDGGKIAVELAGEIRSFGHSARAHFGRWSEVQVVPVAIESGLGELGKNGVLINRRFGPRGSFPIVTTDLPLIPDKQVDLGIQEFCRVCNKCARACPVQAIPTGEPVVANGLSRWPLDGDKCWSFIKENPKCMACMGACPYNKKDLAIHRLAVWLITRKSLVANWLLVKLDDALGYGGTALAYEKQGR